MSTIDLNELASFITQAQKLQEIVHDVVPYIGDIKQGMPNDRLIRAGLLKPYYTDSEFQKFWLSFRQSPAEGKWE